jgi:hypothetical protein
MQAHVMTQNIETRKATPPPKFDEFLDQLRDEFRLSHKLITCLPPTSRFLIS